MQDVHTGHLKLLYNALQADESWEALKEGIKQTVRVQLDGATTPEVAFKLAQEIHAIEVVFYNIETICEAENGATKNA